MIHLHKIMTGTTPSHKSNYNTCHLLGTRLCNDGLTTIVWSSVCLLVICWEPDCVMMVWPLMFGVLYTVLPVTLRCRQETATTTTIMNIITAIPPMVPPTVQPKTL